MYKIFCCHSRNTRKVEVDEITDSLEQCLSMDMGISNFRSFLIKNSFSAEITTLEFVQLCQTILKDLSNLSPHTRESQIPKKTQNDIKNLCTMTEHINFDLHQMNTISDLQSSVVSTDQKMHILQEARTWAMVLLQNVYTSFKLKAISGV